MRYRPLILSALLASPGVQAQNEQPSSVTFGLQDRSSGLGLSPDDNPAIGAHVLLGGAYLSREASEEWSDSIRDATFETGLFFQEAEVGLAAAVDPYFRGDLTIALHSHKGDFHVAVEEGYVTTLFLPRLTLRGGKFFLPFGKHNVLHTHAFPFVDQPLPNVYLFGHEGLNDAAIEASVLVPLPWFVEVSAFAANGDNKILFRSQKGRDLAYGGRLNTLVELGESLTTQIGGRYVGGRNVAGGWTHVFGGDLTLRFRPASRERYHQVIWQSEYVVMRRIGARPTSERHTSETDTPVTEGDENSHGHINGDDLDALMLTQAEVASGLGGFYSFVAAQIAQRWWVQARLDALGYPLGDAKKRMHRASGLFAFVPSEFSAIRLQYSYFHEERIHQVLLQINVTIGAHPAHAY